MENVRYLKYKQENDIFILQLNIDEYREIYNTLHLLNKKRITTKNYYYKIKQKKSVRKTNILSLFSILISLH